MSDPSERKPPLQVVTAGASAEAPPAADSAPPAAVLAPVVPPLVLGPKAAVEMAFHQRQLGLIDEAFEPRLLTLQARQEEVRDKWDQIQAEEDRLPRYSSSFFYWPFMTLLAIGEVPINRLSFELFFRESPVIALAVAFLVGSLLVALAHMVGVAICHFGYHARRQDREGGSRLPAILSRSAGILLGLGLIFGLAYGVAVLRQGYLAFVTQPQVGFAELLQNNQMGQAAAQMLSAKLEVEGLIFLLINLAVVAVGMAAAYFCHDPHPDFEKQDKEKKRVDKDLAKLRSVKGERMARERRRHANKMRSLSA